MTEGLSKLSEVVEGISYKMMEVIVILEIVMEKLDITDEQIKERFKSHIKGGQEDPDKRSIQPTEAGSDEDRGGSGKP